MIRGALGMFLAAFLFAGCLNWTEIRPQELVKLSGPGRVQITTGPSYGQTFTTEWVQLQHLDGRLFEARRSSSVRITFGAKQIHFYSPIQARIVGEDLVINSGNHPPMTIPISTISKTELLR